MSKKLSGQRAATVLATLGLAVGAVVPGAVADPVPAPQSPGNYVSFGDSIPADATFLDVAVNRTKSTHPDLNIDWPTIKDGRCPHGEGNIGAKVGEKTGLEVQDYSCAGAPAYTDIHSPSPQAFFPNQVSAAIDEGNLNPDTKLVSIIIGVNDTYQKENLARTQEERINLYVSTLTEQINRIRAAAPNAKVVLVGYPDETDGQNRTCATSLLGVTSHWYFPQIAYFQDEIRTEQMRVAEETGIPFIDMKEEINIAKGNSGCLQEGDRLNAALFDDTPDHRLGGHLTSNGNEFYGTRIASEYFKD